MHYFVSLQSCGGGKRLRWTQKVKKSSLRSKNIVINQEKNGVTRRGHRERAPEVSWENREGWQILTIPVKVLFRLLAQEEYYNGHYATGDLKFHFALHIKVRPTGIPFFVSETCVRNPAVQVNRKKKGNILFPQPLQLQMYSETDHSESKQLLMWLCEYVRSLTPIAKKTIAVNFQAGDLGTMPPWVECVDGASCPFKKHGDWLMLIDTADLHANKQCFFFL